MLGLSQEPLDFDVRGIRANTIIFTTMIKAYSKVYNFESALAIFHIMVGQLPASHITASDLQLQKPNIITFNSIIDCCVRCSQMDHAS